MSAAADLVIGGGVDFLRCHISAIGGFTPALKLAALAEFFGVQTAWHAPGDTSPVAAAANVALKQASDEMDKEIAKVTGGAKIPGIT